MKILYDISALGTGAYHDTARTGVARVIESLWLALAEQEGVEIGLSACWTPQQWAQARKFVSYTSPGKVNTISPPSSYPVRLYSRMIEKIYPPVGQNSAGRTVVDGLCRALNRFVHNARPMALANSDVFHSTFYPLSGDWPGVPKVITIYDLITLKFPHYFTERHRRYMQDVYDSLGEAEGLIAISESTKSDLCEYLGISPERVTVTPLAASDQFRPCLDERKIAQVRAQYQVPDGAYLLSLCTLEPRKNIDSAIRAYIALFREQSLGDLSLVLVGTRGWDFDRIFDEIDGAGELRERIIVTGFVPDDHLAPLYSGALAFVYPSYYEGFGLPPLEAMQCGTPVITSNTSSLPEVVGDAGIMVDPDDTDALSQAILDLYRDSGLRQSLSKRGLARAERFSWSNCAKATMGAYRKALAG